MEFLFDIGLFTAKALIIVISIGSLMVLFIGLIVRAKAQKPLINIEDLGAHFDQMELALLESLGDSKKLKATKKDFKKRTKKASESAGPKVFVISFEGDIRATHVENLRQEVTAVLSIAKPGEDEIVVCLESPGGMVHTYGLAASQLVRIREAGVQLTVCVDKVAASGGYLMACTANRILAAPFAIVGSIGVLAQVPNFNRLLKKHDIDYEEITAGEYKRTLTVLGEITEKGRAKFTEQITDTHALFKTFVSRFRPTLEMNQVATGEYWYGEQALSLNLVDSIQTSDDYLYKLSRKARVIKVEVQTHKRLTERLAENFRFLLNRATDSVTEKIHNQNLGLD